MPQDITNEEQINNFKESQRFNQAWLWIVLIFASLLPLLLAFLFGLKGHDANFKSAGVTSIVMFVFVFCLLRTFHLNTVVDDNGVYYRFFPIHIKPVFAPWADLEKVYVRKYRPIPEYGGWGMRISFRNGTAYNISGNMGLQLIFKGGKKKILIGTQKPEQLSQLLEQFAHQGIISEEMITPPASTK